MKSSPVFVCPICSSVSYNPDDAAAGYCGRCHVFVDNRGAPSGYVSLTCCGPRAGHGACTSPECICSCHLTEEVNTCF